MRQILPQRRYTETRSMRFWNQTFNVSVGFYPDGAPGEVFISATRTPGTDLDAVCRDAAILLSLCLQHGVPLAVVGSAVTRNPDGSPSTIVGQIADQLRKGT